MGKKKMNRKPQSLHKPHNTFISKRFLIKTVKIMMFLEKHKRIRSLWAWYKERFAKMIKITNPEG